ncbi:MAG TPA: 1-acyl-sn-glycerol-3-phosphate acyltransferase [Candidatus Coprenecus pullistercoris]|nr:1-acyl-sn-glycerol-3-phosphate acyltransferase [Candidatus Coprenecus pullistercoris]
MRLIGKKIAGRMLRAMGWKGMDKAIPAPKCIILGAPHTSIWDFVISWLYYRSVGGNARVMIKKDFFKWPLKPILLHLGAIPVDRSRGGGAHMVRQMIAEFAKDESFQLAIAPEGTRKPVKRWKAGFHAIAKATGVPVYLGYFDWGTKTVGAREEFHITDDVEADLKRLRQWYKDKGVVGKHPEMFTTGDDLD